MPRRLPAELLVVALCAGLAGASVADGTEPAVAPATEAPAAATEPDFKPPPGYKARKRGDKVVYCRKELVEGTRFTKDKCYDRVQLKEIESLMEQQRREMDQRRRICPQPAACG